MIVYFSLSTTDTISSVIKRQIADLYMDWEKNAIVNNNSCGYLSTCTSIMDCMLNILCVDLYCMTKATRQILRYTQCLKWPSILNN